MLVQRSAKPKPAEFIYLSVIFIKYILYYEIMIIGIISFIFTIIIAPLMFWFLSHIVYSKSNLKKYPTQVNDGIGDALFLPIFNSVLFELIFSSNHIINIKLLLIVMLLSIVLTIAYVHYQKNIATYLDWSKPKQGILNFGGWYHAGYMLIQILLVLYALIVFYNNILLWGAISGYILTTIIQIIKDGYI